MGEFVKLFTSKRIELGLSQDEVAERLHVTRQAVSKWETGKAMSDIALMPQIAEILGVSVEELLTGNEPASRVVEKVIIQEKEVKRPMPARKILAIVAPIVLVVVLASALLGVYIPKAIAANTPPIEDNTEPEPPEIVYTEVYIKGKSNTDDSTFQAPIIGVKAYYSLVMQCSSDYTLYITAPKGAVVTLNGEVIAEFDTAKTVEYKQYFHGYHYIKNTEFDASNSVSCEYYLYSDLYSYFMEIDMTACDEDARASENQKVVVRQQMGFEGVTIPANSSYFVALPVSDEASAQHYVIKSKGIKFVNACILMSVHNYQCSVTNFQRNGTQVAIDDFYVINYKNCVENVGNSDWHIGFINQTDEDIELKIEEVPIEEIELGQVVDVESKGIYEYRTIYKLTIGEQYKHTGIQFTLRQSETMYLGFGTMQFFSNKYGIGSTWDVGYRDDDGWEVYDYLHPIYQDTYYVIVYAQEGKDFSFILYD